jgi:alkylated DNA repair protein (DNA oxidative demethylase)
MGSKLAGQRGARSRLGGVPTVVGPPALPARRQLSLGLDLGDDGPAGSGTDTRPGEDGAGGTGVGRRSSPLPGVVHVAGWLDAGAQQALVADFRRWAAPPAGLRRPRVPTGHLMSVQSVCLGWHWSPYAYSRTADDTDGAPVKPLPDPLADLGRAAVAAAYGPGTGAAYRPDAAIVNLYDPDARLGLHQDGEEPSAAPVVTISLGGTATFRMAGPDRRTGPFTDVELASGDLLVFGGPNRRTFHGVPRVRPGTAPDGLGLPPGRLSITLRQTGLGEGVA